MFVTSLVFNFYNKTFAFQEKYQLQLFCNNHYYAIFLLQVTVLTYSWSRDLIDQLHHRLTKMLQWATARQALLSSISLQKLSLFRQQPFCRRVSPTSSLYNPFIGPASLVDSLIKSPVPSKEHFSVQDHSTSRRGAGGTPLQKSSVKFANQAHQLKYIQQVRFGRSSMQGQNRIKDSQNRIKDSQNRIKDSQNRIKDGQTPKGNFSSSHAYCYLYQGFPPPALQIHSDPLVSHGSQLTQLANKASYKKSVQRCLSDILDSDNDCGNLSVLDSKSLKIILKNTKIVHYVYTPILFLPRWRALVAAIRDFQPPPPPPPSSPVRTSPADTPDFGTNRSRHNSATSNTIFRQSLYELRR